jgi:SH3 domain-containing YSC84-like protein 1
MKLRFMVWLSIFLIGSLGVSVARADQTKTDVEDRLQSSAKSIGEILNAPDKGIPDEVLKGAKCIGVVPSMIKGAFILGAKHGRGVATCRLPNGKWSAPDFFSISGGSWGLQFGVEDVQLVIMVMTDDGMRHLLNNKFQIGGAASAAAGPVGRTAEAGMSWKADTDFLTYSRSHGLFAGIDLDGSWIEHDTDSTSVLYGKDFDNTQILTGKVATPAMPAAHQFLAEIHRAELAEHNKSAQAKEANKP